MGKLEEIYTDATISAIETILEEREREQELLMFLNHEEGW